MNRLKLLTLILLSTLLAVYAGAESIQLTSYYPAPRGAYDRLLLTPRDDLPVPCDVGLMYVSSTDNALYFCQEDGSGNTFWGPIGGVWTLDANDQVFLIEGATNPDLKVGIGDETPDAHLEVSSSGGAEDFIMFSTDDGDDGDVFIIQNDGDVGINTLDPQSTLAVTSRGNTAATNAIRVVNSDGAPVLFASDDGNVGIGTENNLDNRLEVNGNTEILNTSADTRLRFTEQTGGSWYSMGIDVSDGGNFKINFGETIGERSGIIMAPNGDVTIEGNLTVMSNGTDAADVMVQYVPGSNPGYYATYAP